MLDYVGEAIHSARDQLSALDRDIGDGDHGVSMDIGWRAIHESIHALCQPSVSDVFGTAGSSFLQSVGATVGPLYATMFYALGKASQNKEVLTGLDAEPLFAAAISALKRRSKAEIGDKTMMDVWIPALDAFEGAMGRGVAEAAAAALAAGENGLHYTKDLAAGKGRASHLGDRSIGHVDPGAQSAWILLRSVVTWIQEQQNPTNV